MHDKLYTILQTMLLMKKNSLCVSQDPNLILCYVRHDFVASVCYICCIILASNTVRYDKLQSLTIFT